LKKKSKKENCPRTGCIPEAMRKQKEHEQPKKNGLSPENLETLLQKTKKLTPLI